MKRVFCLIALLALIVGVIPISVQAAETITTVEYLEDGSYIVTEITESYTRMLTKVGSKTRTYYDTRGNLEWKIVVTGEFLYDGTTATCTYATGTTTIYQTARWYKISDGASYSGNAATYSVTCGYKDLGVTTGTESYSVTLHCDQNGNLS